MKSIYRKYFAIAALVWVGCFILFLFVYMFVLAPQKKSKEHFGKQLAEKKQICNSAQKAAQQETKIQLEKQIEHLRNSLKDFVFEDSADLTFDISQIANKKRINPPPSIKGKNNREHSQIPDSDYICEDHVNINFTAGFNQFAALLNALERHRPVIFVDKFIITRSNKDDSGHQVNMSLSVFVMKRRDS